MSERRFKVRIKGGQVEVETMTGFSDGQCHSTVEAIVNGAGLTQTDGKDKDLLPVDDPTVFVAGA